MNRIRACHTMCGTERHPATNLTLPCIRVPHRVTLFFLSCLRGHGRTLPRTIGLEKEFATRIRLRYYFRIVKGRKNFMLIELYISLSRCESEIMRYKLFDFTPFTIRKLRGEAQPSPQGKDKKGVTTMGCTATKYFVKFEDARAFAVQHTEEHSRMRRATAKTLSIIGASEGWEVVWYPREGYHGTPAKESQYNQNSPEAETLKASAKRDTMNKTERKYVQASMF